MPSSPLQPDSVRVAQPTRDAQHNPTAVDAARKSQRAIQPTVQPSIRTRNSDAPLDDAAGLDSIHQGFSHSQLRIQSRFLRHKLHRLTTQTDREQ